MFTEAASGTLAAAYRQAWPLPLMDLDMESSRACAVTWLLREITPQAIMTPLS